MTITIQTRKINERYVADVIAHVSDNPSVILWRFTTKGFATPQDAIREAMLEIRFTCLS